MQVLDNYRIIEIGTGPTTGLAGMVFADFGADVLKINPPGGDPFAAMASYRLWTRGKTIAEVDLNDRNQVEELRNLILESADAVITTLKRNKREQTQLDASSLRAERPDLVYGIVSGFGESGPYAEYAGYEGVVAAKSGRMQNFAGVADRSGPNFSALQVGVHATSQSLVAATLAALEKRERTGQGSEFHTSLLRGMIPYEMGVCALSQLYDKGIVPRPPAARDRTRSMPTLNYHPVRTKDGKWLQLGNLLPHLLDNYLRATGFDEVFEEERYKGEPMRWDRQVLEEFRDRIFTKMQTRTISDWTDHYVKDGGVVSHAYQTTQEALSDPDVVDNGHVVERNGEKQLGLLARLTKTPGKVNWDPQELTLAQVQSREVSIPSIQSSESSKKPLAGVTVVESATIIAAPLGAATLADMGARVIKLEPLSGDPFRSMMHSLGASKCNVGKESICLDLKSEEGKRIAQQLAAKADIWIHNYRVGVPEKLGIGYDELSEINPKLVYISANGYGPEGPGAKRPSTHPIPGAALGGVVWQLGGLPSEDQEMDSSELRETARKLLRANEVNPDPNTSMVVASTAVLGLCAARRSGAGQKIFIDMFGANAYANWDDFLSYPGKPERPPLDSQALGLDPLYRLYETGDGWVFLAAVSDAEKAKLERALEVDTTNENLASNLSQIFQTKRSLEWEKELTAQGVTCVQADGEAPPGFFMNDEHVRAERLLVSAIHPQWGEYLRLGPMVEFDAEATYPGTGAAGGATLDLLAELGYEPAKIDTLLSNRVVGVA